MSNSISFTGRLGKDPELKQAGQSDVLEFSVGNNVGWGERRITNWFKCSLWGKQAVSMQPHLEKGKEIFISGELTAREYTTRDGEKKTSLDVKVSSIDFVGGGKKSDGGEYKKDCPQSKPQQMRQEPENDADLPF
jgi:single-strand DNA-binding protein